MSLRDLILKKLNFLILSFPGEFVIITREPGEKLGFGLKFFGGNSGSNERVKKLFIQSCAANR